MLIRGLSFHAGEVDGGTDLADCCARAPHVKVDQTNQTMEVSVWDSCHPLGFIDDSTISLDATRRQYMTFAPCRPLGKKGCGLSGRPPTLSSESRSDLVNYAVSTAAAVEGGAVDVARAVRDQASAWIESVGCAGKAVDHGIFAAGILS